MSTIKVDRILIALKLQSTGMSTFTVYRIFVALKPTIDMNVNFLYWQDFGQLWKLHSTGMPTPTIGNFSVALKATFNKNVNSHYWEDVSSSEGYSRQEIQLPLFTGFWWLWELQCLKATIDMSVNFHCWVDFR